MEILNQKDNTLQKGDIFQMFSMSGENNSQQVKIIEIAGKNARVVCGSQPAILPVDLIKKFDRL